MKRKTQFLKLSCLPLVIGAVVALAACAASGGAVPTPQPTQLLITPVKGQLVVIVDVANLRSGPGTEFSQVGTLMRGEVITTVGVSSAGDWKLIQLPGSPGGPGEAWISASFLAPVSATTPTVQRVQSASPTPTPFILASALPQQATVTATKNGLTPSVPTAAPTVCAFPLNWLIYIVQPGDTLTALAYATGTSVQQLLVANCQRDDRIYAGQQLFVPRLPAPAVTLVPPDTPTFTPTATPPQATEPPTPVDTPIPVPTATFTLVPPDLPTNTPPSSTEVPPGS